MIIRNKSTIRWKNVFLYYETRVTVPLILTKFKHHPTINFNIYQAACAMIKDKILKWVVLSTNSFIYYC